jgi:hypothetical protein
MKSKLDAQRIFALVGMDKKNPTKCWIIHRKKVTVVSACSLFMRACGVGLVTRNDLSWLKCALTGRASKSSTASVSLELLLPSNRPSDFCEQVFPDETLLSQSANQTSVVLLLPSSSGQSRGVHTVSLTACVMRLLAASTSAQLPLLCWQISEK